MKTFRAISGQFPEDLVVYNQNVTELLDPGDYYGTVRFKVTSETEIDEEVPSIPEQYIAAFCDHGFDNLVEPDIIVDRYLTFTPSPEPKMLVKSAGNGYSYLTPKIARMALEQLGQKAFELETDAFDLISEWSDCAEFYQSLNPTLVDLKIPALQEPFLAAGNSEALDTEAESLIPEDEHVVIIGVHVPGEEEFKETVE